MTADFGVSTETSNVCYSNCRRRSLPTPWTNPLCSSKGQSLVSYLPSPLTAPALLPTFIFSFTTGCFPPKINVCGLCPLEKQNQETSQLPPPPGYLPTLPSCGQLTTSNRPFTARALGPPPAFSWVTPTRLPSSPHSMETVSVLDPRDPLGC